MFSSIGAPELGGILLVALLFLAFPLFVLGRIFSKAGYSRWLGLTMIVPLVNLIVLVWFAFADWPATRK